MIKSGTDFRDLSVITAEIKNTQFSILKHENIIIDSSINEDEELKKIIDKYARKFINLNFKFIFFLN